MPMTPLGASWIADAALCQRLNGPAPPSRGARGRSALGSLAKNSGLADYPTTEAQPQQR